MKTFTEYLNEAKELLHPSRLAAPAGGARPPFLGSVIYLLLLFLLNSSSRERLVVTGRAGWMGMGRGAGRPALGFWPTLAFLLCSFPAGKALLQPGNGRLGARGPLPRSPRGAGPQVCGRVGAQVRRAPSGPRLAFPRVFVSPASSRRRDGCAWAPGVGGTLSGCNEKEPGGEITGAGDVSQLPRKGGTRDVPLRGPGEGGEREARTRIRGALSLASRPAVCRPVRCPGVEPGAPLRSPPSPDRPLPRDPVPPPRACPRGEAHGLGTAGPLFLCDNIPRRPLFVFIVSERERISELKLKKPICFQ